MPEITPLDRVRESILRSLWQMLAWVFLPIYTLLFALEWQSIVQDPVRLLVYIGLPLGTLLLRPGSARPVATRGRMAILFFGVLTVPVLIKTGLRQPSASVTAIMTMVLAAMFESPRTTRHIAVALVLAAAIGVALRSAGLIQPSAVPPANLTNDLLRSLVLVVASVLVATMPLAAVRIYEEARAAQQREFERRLQAEKNEVNLQRQELVANLARGMTHDLANLLQGVGVGIEVLREVGDEQYRRRVLDDLSRLTNKAITTLRSLLAVGQPASLIVGSTCMARSIESLGSFLPALLGAQIDIRTRCTTSAAVPLTPDRFEQVMLNLAVNARDAMPRGGTLEIVAEDATEVVDARQVDGVRIRVSDSGSGIPADLLPNVFVPYFSTKEPSDGTGLGLPTVARIVQGADGRIEVSSEVGRGTTIVIWLPVASSAMTAASSARRQLPPAYRQS